MYLTTASNLPPEVQRHFDNKLLAIHVQNTIHTIAADRRRMPSNAGNTMVMSRPGKLATAKVPLGTSGTLVPGQLLTRVDIEAKIQFHGTYVGINEQVTLQNQDKALNTAVKLLGICLRETEDELTRDMLAAGASLIRCTGGTNGDTPTEVTLSDIQTAELALKSADARLIESSIEATNKIGTAPTRNAFYMLSHVNMSKPFYNLGNSFIARNQYPSQKAHPSEIGAIEGFRVFTSSMGSVTASGSANGNDVYNNIGVGLESYCIIDQEGYGSQFIYTPPGMTGDPLAQNAYAAMKFAYGSCIQDELWALNLSATL